MKFGTLLTLVTLIAKIATFEFDEGDCLDNAKRADVAKKDELTLAKLILQTTSVENATEQLTEQKKKCKKFEAWSKRCYDSIKDDRTVDVSILINTYKTSCNYVLKMGCVVQAIKKKCWNINFYHHFTYADLLKNGTEASVSFLNHMNNEDLFTRWEYDLANTKSDVKKEICCISSAVETCASKRKFHELCDDFYDYGNLNLKNIAQNKKDSADNCNPEDCAYVLNTRVLCEQNKVIDINGITKTLISTNNYDKFALEFSRLIFIFDRVVWICHNKLLENMHYSNVITYDKNSLKNVQKGIRDWTCVRNYTRLRKALECFHWNVLDKSKNFLETYKFDKNSSQKYMRDFLEKFEKKNEIGMLAWTRETRMDLCGALRKFSWLVVKKSKKVKACSAVDVSAAYTEGLVSRSRIRMDCEWIESYILSRRNGVTMYSCFSHLFLYLWLGSFWFLNIFYNLINIS